MNAEFFAAIEDIEREKNIPKAYMLDKINQALLAAFRRDNPDCADNVVVQKTVVETVESPAVELTVEEARRYAKHPALGDVIGIPVETKKFGRIAAQAAKQVIIQGIREAERGITYEEFTSKEHEILTGVVSRVEPRSGSVSIKIQSNSEYTEAMLAATERIKGEELTEGDRVKVYVVEVRRSTRGPQVLISRTHPGLVKRLFELEVPEIFDGTVEIRSIAREAGSRTKMAVWSNDPDVDPIGACVGPKGGRVSSIVSELGGEKIDIVKYSEDPELYIAAALSPAEVVSVTLLDEGKNCRVVVPDGQLSLAIGKEGQNARLAAKLTGYKIDIKPESEAQE
ncbi:MAG: transcription termination factor NusA [Eubacteriales bacterium]|nr:transcription termination factor NusA [Eubacteriales bacterium]